MPVYNASRYLKEAIQSILNQTYRDFEFIIINDGSTDDSSEIIQSFSDTRIRFINNEKNLGIIQSRNIGLEAARGFYIANMDADDISLPERFQKQLAYMESNPETVILSTRLVLVNEKNEETGIWPEDYHCITATDIKNTLPVINCIGQPTIMMRADVIKQIRYNDRFKANEDWGLWLQVLSQGGVIQKLPDVLLRYRQHSASITATANTTGVDKKLIRFKSRYIRYKLFKDKFHGTDKQVLRSLIKDIARLLFKIVSPRFYNFLFRVKSLDKKRFITQLKSTRQFFKNNNRAASVIYFFPSFHTGGAERVHASIMEAVNAKNAITFITGTSANNTFLGPFSNYSTVLEIDQLITIGFSERWLSMKIRKCAVARSTKLLGCNSNYFYTVVAELPAEVEVTDLTHAFVHAYEEGPEKWSLPVVEKIHTRVVINRKTMFDFEALYKKNNIPRDLLSRILVIPNFVEAHLKLPVKKQEPFKVAYVGRGGDEKRLHLIAQIAKNVTEQIRGIEFHFVGDVIAAIPEKLRSYCIIHPEVKDETALQKLYEQFHVLIITSSREGFPMVIMEGMMQGVVPVSTDVGGISEHVLPGKNGYLVTSTSESSIVIDFEEKIKFLEAHRGEWAKMSENAHRYAIEHFDKTAFFKAWAELLGHQKTKN